MGVRTAGGITTGGDVGLGDLSVGDGVHYHAGDAEVL